MVGVGLQSGTDSLVLASCAGVLEELVYGERDDRRGRDADPRHPEQTARADDPFARGRPAQSERRLPSLPPCEPDGAEPERNPERDRVPRLEEPEGREEAGQVYGDGDREDGGDACDERCPGGPGSAAAHSQGTT